MFSKFRIARGPLRWWLMVAGLAFGQVSAARFGGGIALIALGTVLHVWSKAALWQNRQLSTDGPYRFTRNPFYLANLLIDGGLLFLIGRWEVALLGAAAWAWVYHRTIAAEEATLRGLFGDAFDDYCRRVPRFLPWPGRYLKRDQVDGPGWSWRNGNLATGREWTRACRVLACPWLLLAAAILRGQAEWAATPLGFGVAGVLAGGWFALGAIVPGLQKAQLRAHAS